MAPQSITIKANNCMRHSQNNIIGEKLNYQSQFNSNRKSSIQETKMISLSLKPSLILKFKRNWSLQPIFFRFWNINVFKNCKTLNSYTLMTDYIRSKSFSHDRLNLTVNFFLPERSPNLLFRIRNPDHFQEHSFKNKMKTKKEHTLAPSTRLEEFKSRLINVLNNTRGLNKQSKFEDVPLFQNIKLNQFFSDCDQRQNFCTQVAEGSIYVQKKGKKQEQMRSRHLSYQRKCKKSEIWMQSQKKDLVQLQAAKHSKSIMIIRKINQMKEKIILSKKEKFQQQLYKRKETPIHSKSLNAKRTHKSKTEQKNKSSSKIAIRDILRSRDMMARTGEVFKKASQNQTFEIVVKGEAKFDQNLIFKRNSQSLKISVEEYKNHKKKINVRKKMAENGAHKKREEEIGPWGKSKNAEIQLQF